MKENECHSIYAMNLPYPEVRIDRPNKAYAYLLLTDYAGVSSELGSSCLYMYQYLTLYDSYKEVASILEGIAKVERVHLQMLGKMIKALGVEPKYEGVERGKMRPWNANYLSYDTGVKEIIKVGMREEEKSIRQYRDHISRIQDRNIQEALQRILLDEKHHLEIFRSLYKRYGE